MRKLSYFFLLCIIMSIMVVVSCNDKELEHDDSELPEINNIRFNYEDTIMVDDSSSAKQIPVYYNGGNGNPRLLEDRDILIIGHRVWLTATFRDNHGLSAAYVRIWGDTSSVKNLEDTCFRLKIKPSFNMQGKKELLDTTVVLGGNLIPQTIYSSSSKKHLIVREGWGLDDSEDYRFSIQCLDLAGNENTESYNRYPIAILTRKTVDSLWQERQKAAKK